MLPLTMKLECLFLASHLTPALSPLKGGEGVRKAGAFVRLDLPFLTGS